MITEAEERAALERALNGPAPYSSGNPVPRPAMDRLPKGSAARELAEVLGRPALAGRVTELCGPHVAAVLAEAVSAAVVRRTRDLEVRLAAELDRAHAAIVDRWNEPDCVAPEPTPARPPSTTWGMRVDLHQPPSVLVGVLGAALDEATQQARVTRFMAGGNDG